MFWPCETRTSTCRNFATISSGLYRFLAIAVLLDVKDIPQVGPLQWGRIISARSMNSLRGSMTAYALPCRRFADALTDCDALLKAYSFVVSLPISRRTAASCSNGGSSSAALPTVKAMSRSWRRPISDDPAPERRTGVAGDRPHRHARGFDGLAVLVQEHNGHCSFRGPWPLTDNGDVGVACEHLASRATVASLLAQVYFAPLRRDGSGVPSDVTMCRWRLQAQRQPDNWVRAGRSDRFFHIRCDVPHRHPLWHG